MELRVKERVLTDPLAGIDVVDDPYAVFATDNPYAALVNPYAALAENPYAVFADNPYTQLADNPYAAPTAGVDAGKQKRPKPRPRRIVKRTIVLLPGSRASMLWLPVVEFDRCFESWCDSDLWQPGHVVDFTEAAEAAQFTWGDEVVAGESLEDAFCLGAAPIDGEAETLRYDYLPYERFSPLWDDVIRAVGELRAELRADPTPITATWDAALHNTIRLWTGARVPIGADGILAAIATDPMNGVGGAALDYCCWWRPDEFGRLGAEIREYLTGIEEDESIWMEPVENFILDAAKLHPATKTEKYYNLYGDYTVDRIAYHSDPEAQGVVGFRSVFLEPTGEPKRPHFAE